MDLIKKIKENNKKTKIIIGILFAVLIISFFGYKQYKFQKYENELTDYIKNETLKDVEYVNFYLDNKKCNLNELHIIFKDDFDEKSNEDKANILGEVMKKFENERTFLMVKHKLCDNKKSSSEKIKELPEITAMSKNIYKYSSIDELKDAEGNVLVDNYSKYNSSSNDVSVNANSDNDNSPELEVISKEDKYVSEYDYAIIGEVKNNRNYTMHNVFIRINLYDEEGKLLGDAIDSIDYLDANSIWKFKCNILSKYQEGFKSYKVVELTGYK